jgi:ATP-dependent DNA helicase RecG
MKNNGSPPAEFEFDEDHSYFLVRLPVQPQVDTQPGDQATPQVTPQVAKVLELITGELSRGKLMAGLGLTDRKHFRVDYLQPAIEEGVIEMSLPDKPNSSKQRYRLTEKGRALLARGKSAS